MNNRYKILLSATLLANFGDNLIGPFYAVFVEKIGGGILAMGYSATVFSICTGILMVIVGKMSDNLNKELITIAGYALYALGSILYLLISNPWHLFVLQIVFAFGTACLSAPLTALFAKHIQKGREGMQWGIEGGVSYIVVGIAVFIGTLIVNQWGFKVLFLTMFLIQIMAVLIQTKLYFATRKKQNSI
ncbi:MAG: MFS transporter [Candidatus Doudnabacteria bacterium]|nr:MFS transporter [Candidatus Doudnabacteria bacterium]